MSTMYGCNAGPHGKPAGKHPMLVAGNGQDVPQESGKHIDAVEKSRK